MLPAQRVTNETYRWVSDARFHPSGSKVIATKWYTSERSLGAGEGWEYTVPSAHELRAQHLPVIKPGSGQRLNSRLLPRGWTPAEYGDQQIGPEQHIWHGSDAIIFAKNVRDASQFEYSKGESANWRLGRLVFLKRFIVYLRCAFRNLCHFPEEFDYGNHQTTRRTISWWCQ